MVGRHVMSLTLVNRYEGAAYRYAAAANIYAFTEKYLPGLGVLNANKPLKISKYITCNCQHYYLHRTIYRPLIAASCNTELMPGSITEISQMLEGYL